MAHNPGQHNTLLGHLDGFGGSNSGGFAGIPQTFDDLFIVFKDFTTTHATSDQHVHLWFNNDTTAANYSYAYSTQNSTSYACVWADDSYICYASAQDTVLGGYGNIWIPDYTATFKKMVSSLVAMPINTNMAGHANIYNRQYQLRWETTDPIAQITFAATENFDNRSQVYLYGVSYNRP